MRAWVLLWGGLAATGALARAVDVPVQVGFGPAVHTFFGRVSEDQPVHFGIQINVEAILDREWLRRNQRLIPKQYKKFALAQREVRVGPSIFLPSTLIISPRFRNTGMFGVSWRPYGVILLPVKAGDLEVTLGAKLVVTYAFLYSTVLPQTHFIRPGVSIGLEAEYKLSADYVLGFGYGADIYVPQKLGEFGIGTPFWRDSIFVSGTGNLTFNVRFIKRLNL